MNYNNHNDTISLSPCANQAPPEVTLTDIVRTNSSDLKNIDYVVNSLYTHLYGNIAPHDASNETDPTCLRDEITAQSHKLLVINEKLALICAKLGV